MTPVTQLLAAVALAAVILVAEYQSTARPQDERHLHRLVITTMMLLIQPFKHLADVMAPLTRGTAAMERGIEIIESIPIEHGGTLAPGRVRGDIEFRDVGLNYRPADAPEDTPRAALADVSLADPRRRDGRLRRPVGRGQDLAGQPAAALHRADERRGRPRRRRARRLRRRRRCARSSRW